jgi:osmotically-inducible protein OsmY
MKLSWLSCVLAGVVVSGLSGCAPLIVGGALVGSVVAIDRRTAGAQLEDEALELKVASAVRRELGDRVHLNVNSYNRRVLLTGEAATAADRERSERLALSQENVKGVTNELAVMSPSSVTQRSKDVYISSRVKAAYLDAKDLQVNSLHVVTERGVVHLMGLVTQREAARATEIARSVGGVVKVVLVFDIISEDELKRLSQPPLSK